MSQGAPGAPLDPNAEEGEGPSPRVCGGSNPASTLISHFWLPELPQGFYNLTVHTNSWRILLTSGSDSAGLGRGLRFCISQSSWVMLMLLVHRPALRSQSSGAYCHRQCRDDKGDPWHKDTEVADPLSHLAGPL